MCFLNFVSSLQHTFYLFIRLTDTVAAKQRHLQDTLSGYGRSVVREMRALAAERDKTLIQTDSAAQGAVPAAVKDEMKSVDGKTAKAAKTVKKKVAHIVDKMLFNYRNIGKGILCPFLPSNFAIFF